MKKVENYAIIFFIALFIIMLLSFFGISSAIGQPLSYTADYKLDTLSVVETVTFNGFKRDTMRQYYVVEAVAYLDSVSKDIDTMVYSSPDVMWNKATYEQRLEWCQLQVQQVLFTKKYPIQVHNYIANYGKYAIYEYNETLETGKYTILASGTLLQGILETGVERKKKGMSSLAKTHNNHFGVKCAGWKGKKVYYEDDCKNKAGKIIDCCFKAYPNDHDSFRDHTRLLCNPKSFRYRKVRVAKTVEQYCEAIGRSGYATSPTYGRDLLAKAKLYQLSQFDVKYNETYWRDRKDNRNTSPKITSTW